MNIRPATPPAPGEATNADRTWACNYLSALLGRPIRGGLRVDQLATKLADERHHATIPAPRNPA